MDVKRWLESPPSVDTVRPGSCPRCAAAGAAPGRPKGLHGHGLRERQLRGPAAPGASPTLVVVRVRRYRCQRCGAVLTVAPRETATARLYTLSAVAWALALFGVSRLSEHDVRRRTSPWTIVGPTAVRRWISLRRWVAAVRQGRLLRRLARPPDRCAARVAAGQIAIQAAAHASPTLTSLPLPARAFHGAVRAA